VDTAVCDLLVRLSPERHGAVGAGDIGAVAVSTVYAGFESRQWRDICPYSLTVNGPMMKAQLKSQRGGRFVRFVTLRG
jgi:hypothetical protein